MVGKEVIVDLCEDTSLPPTTHYMMSCDTKTAILFEVIFILLVGSRWNGVFWLNIAEFGVFLHYGHCSNLIRELRRERPMLKFQQKYEREREKVGERKFGISAMALPKFLLPKKLTEINYGNDIAEIGGKKILWQLWQCHCLKWEGEKKVVAEIWEELK